MYMFFISKKNVCIKSFKIKHNSWKKEHLCYQYLLTLCSGGSFGCEESETSLSPVKPEALLENAAIDSELFEVGSSSKIFTDVYIKKGQNQKLAIQNVVI